MNIRQEWWLPRIWIYLWLRYIATKALEQGRRRMNPGYSTNLEFRICPWKFFWKVKRRKLMLKFVWWILGEMCQIRFSAQKAFPVFNLLLLFHCLLFIWKVLGIFQCPVLSCASKTLVIWIVFSYSFLAIIASIPKLPARLDNQTEHKFKTQIKTQ